MVYDVYIIGSKGSMIRLKEKFLQAIQLRKNGFSLKEISEKLRISKSTASLWLRDTVLTRNAQQRLKNRIRQGQRNSATKKKAETEFRRQGYLHTGLKLIQNFNFNKKVLKIFCALMYLCEGSKDDGIVQFTNSDPQTVRAFVNLFRKSFRLDESKFRISLHLHSYHFSSRQIRFWSKITKVPSGQFMKPYIKPNSGKRIKKDYQGCINLRYYSADVAKELIGIALAFIQYYGRVG